MKTEAASSGTISLILARSGHNISLHHVARAYHLRALASSRSAWRADGIQETRKGKRRWKAWTTC
jgi:hypothetical protein